MAIAFNYDSLSYGNATTLNHTLMNEMERRMREEYEYRERKMREEYQMRQQYYYAPQYNGQVVQINTNNSVEEKKLVEKKNKLKSLIAYYYQRK